MAYGFLHGSFCPHYDAEDQRQPLFHASLLSGELATGYAVGNLQSLHFEGSELVTAISPVEDPLALRVEAVDGRIVETPLPTEVLASTGTIAKGPSS